MKVRSHVETLTHSYVDTQLRTWNLSEASTRNSSRRLVSLRGPKARGNLTDHGILFGIWNLESGIEFLARQSS